MKYLSNFINNIKFLFTNNLICVENLEDGILTLNKRIDFIHQKLEDYQIKDIDMMKIYIDENSDCLKENNERIKELENYLNIFSKHSVFQDIKYPLIERIEKLEIEINNIISYIDTDEINK